MWWWKSASVEGWVWWNLSRSISLLAPSFSSLVLLWNIPDPWLLAQQNSLFWGFCLLCWASSTWWVLLAHREPQQTLELGQSQLWEVVKKTENSTEIKIIFFTEEIRDYRQSILWYLSSKIFCLIYLAICTFCWCRQFLPLLYKRMGKTENFWETSKVFAWVAISSTMQI